MLSTLSAEARESRTANSIWLRSPSSSSFDVRREIMNWCEKNTEMMIIWPKSMTNFVLLVPTCNTCRHFYRNSFFPMNSVDWTLYLLLARLQSLSDSVYKITIYVWRSYCASASSNWGLDSIPFETWTNELNSKFKSN